MGLHDTESIFFRSKVTNILLLIHEYSNNILSPFSWKILFFKNMVSEMAQPYCYPHFIMFTLKLMKYQYHWLKFISILEVYFYLKISNEIARSIYYY